MESFVEIPKEINILNFQSLLGENRDFKSCLREIKINNILNKKCQLEIDNVNVFCNFKSDLSGFQTLLQSSAIVIKEILFTINPDMTISDLKITYKILETKMGKVFNELVKLEIPIKISTISIIDSEYPNNFIQIVGFSIDQISN